MAESLTALLNHKADILQQISDLGDFRPGSITATSGRCGNPGCHCHRPGHVGHTHSRLTYKAQGKTITESVPDTATREKAEREIQEYRHWQQLSRQFVDLNAAICKARPLAEPHLTPQEKKRRKPSSRKSGGKSTSFSS